MRPEVPASFLKEAARRFGEPGARWACELPDILAACIARWELTDCAPLKEQSINLVCFAHSPRFGHVVLKVQAPHTERYTEIEALRLYDGRNACRILAVDLPSASILMGRVLPGTSLRSLPDRGEQLRVGAQMIRDLPVPVPPACTLPTYQEWLQVATGKMMRSPHLDGPMGRLLGLAASFFNEMEKDQGDPMVLHGDLHHDNILRAGADRWVAIDPQGVIGSAFLEAGRFVQNHDVMGLSDVDLPAVRSTIRYVADRLGQPPGHIARTLFIMHVLSTCWDYEMTAPLAELERQKRQCEQMLALIQ